MTTRTFELTILSLLAVATITTAATHLPESRSAGPENRSAAPAEAQPRADAELATCPFAGERPMQANCPALEGVVPSTGDVTCPFDPGVGDEWEGATPATEPLPAEAI